MSLEEPDVGSLSDGLYKSIRAKSRSCLAARFILSCYYHPRN